MEKRKCIRLFIYMTDENVFSILRVGYGCPTNSVLFVPYLTHLTQLRSETVSDRRISLGKSQGHISSPNGETLRELQVRKVSYLTERLELL